MDVKVGDWVSFYQGGIIVYGKVEYLKKRIGVYDDVCTTVGTVSKEYILEARYIPPPEASKSEGIKQA